MWMTSSKTIRCCHFLYNTRDADPNLLSAVATFDDFNLCQREANDDGAVLELYVSRQFSCELVTSADRFTVQYDNGARIENLLFAIDQILVDLTAPMEQPAR